MTQGFDSLGREINTLVRVGLRIIAPSWKLSECPLIGVWIKKLLFSYSRTIDTCNDVNRFQKTLSLVNMPDIKYYILHDSI